MDYLELLKRDVEKNSLLLAKQVADYWGNPDVIIFIAKGAYLIGNTIAQYFDKPLLGIHASRKANILKKLLSNIFSIIPYKIKVQMRKLEIKSSYHKQHVERNVWFDKVAWKKYSHMKRVLIVDDSVDTGNTIKAVIANINRFMPDAVLRTASLNYFSFCMKEAKPDFFIWVDTMLNGPWSNDSKENKQFLTEYEIARKEKRFL